MIALFKDSWPHPRRKSSRRIQINVCSKLELLGGNSGESHYEEDGEKKIASKDNKTFVGNL